MFKTNVFSSGTLKTGSSKLGVQWPLFELVKRRRREKRDAPRTARLREDTEKGEL
jgi:hypothetical protein